MELDVRLSGEVVLPVSWRPGRLVFANAGSGQSSSQSIVLRVAGAPPAEVLGASTDHPSLATRVRRCDDGRHEISVDYDGSLDREPDTATVTIRTSHPEQPTVRVPVTFLR